MQAMVEEQLRLQQTNRALEDMDKQRVRKMGWIVFLPSFLSTRRARNNNTCITYRVKPRAGRGGTLTMMYDV